MSAARLIPWVVHEVVEYAAGVFLILVPFVWFRDELDSTAAFPLFVAVGVVMVALQLLTGGKASIADLLPVRVHATLDYLVAIFLILSPFLFGLTAADEPDEALFVPILLGAGYLVVTLLTRFPLEEAAPSEGASAAGSQTASPSAGEADTSPPHSPQPNGSEGEGGDGGDG